MSLCTKLTRLQSIELYHEVLNKKDTEAMRRLCREDLFFLIYLACKRPDLNHDWIYARCREVEASPDGYIDLWAREHYKSTIITFGMSIKDILNDPEVTIGIFSHTRPIAKAFLAQIKQELERNTFLQGLFSDVLYANPQKESPCWSLDNGIQVRRKTNPKEKTIEAWGLVDGQPTSKHFRVLNYDDVVTRESVGTPEMILKTTEAWATSLNLASTEDCKYRYSGTHYHQNDTYKEIIARGAAVPRYHYPTDKGRDDIAVEGVPVLLSQEALLKKRSDMGLYVYGCQMLLNPSADKIQGFDLDWLMFYNSLSNYMKWNYYLLCDPASDKKKTSDYTVMAVIGLAPDKNYYLVDGIRDRMNLTERTRQLMAFHRKWQPKKTGYEKYGQMSDIEHIKYVQEQEGYRFEISELGGAIPKNDRIRRLVPIFEGHRFYLPRGMIFVSLEKKAVDFIHEFINYEYTNFPVCTHDDMLDCMARITDEDLCAVFPKIEDTLPKALPRVERYDPLKGNINMTQQQAYNPFAGVGG